MLHCEGSDTKTETGVMEIDTHGMRALAHHAVMHWRIPHWVFSSAMRSSQRLTAGCARHEGIEQLLVENIHQRWQGFGPQILTTVDYRCIYNGS